MVTPIDITPRPEEPSGRGRPLLTILAVLVGFGLGFVVARSPSTRSPQPTPTLVADVGATGSQCSLQNGRTLQVGIEVSNRGTATAEILSVQASAPLGGLNLREVGWGACGQLRPVQVGVPDSGGPPRRLIPPGGTDWMYARYDVVVDCPAPYPVRFLIDSVGSTGLVDIGGFADLGNVPYTGCT